MSDESIIIDLASLWCSNVVPSQHCFIIDYILEVHTGHGIRHLLGRLTVDSTGETGGGIRGAPV